MSIVNPSILPGFIELLPEEQKLFDKLKAIIEKNFIKYGFVNLDTPTIEKEEILLSKGGGETSKQIYRIDKESTAQALRFDLTVSLARYVAMHSHELVFPFRRYQIGKVYRGERNQKGRYREFYQCDIDIIGNEKLDILNDAEIPAVIYNIFKDLGITDVTFHINNRKLLNGFFESIDLEDFETCMRSIDKLSKIGEEKVREILLEAGLSIGQIEEIFSFIRLSDKEDVIKSLEAYNIDNSSYKEGLEEIKKVYEYMQKFGINQKSIKIDLSITRGLDYYTGTVIETFLDGYESIGSVCSGGRYEDLASNFTKQKFPGIGLSIGLSRLFYQLNEAGLLKEKTDDQETSIVVIPMSDDDIDYAIKIVDNLRANNLASLVYLEGGKMRKKFQFADRLNSRHGIIIGEEERLNGLVSVRDFESGKQETVAIDKLVDYLGGDYEG